MDQFLSVLSRHQETCLRSASSSTRHTLVKFFPLNVPRRFVADKDHFMRNLAVGLAARGLAPPFIKDVSAVYFGRRRHLGMVRQWVEGRTLHQLIVDGGGGKDGFSLRSDPLFADLGVALARFHLLGNDADFRRGVIERHFPSAAPMALLRLEEWRRGALLSLVCSSLGQSPVWGDLYRDVIEAGSDVVRVVGAAVGNLKTAEALRPVFGHNDCTPSNIVVRDDAAAEADSGGVYLIDEEWAAPNLAIYDFANFVMAMTLLRLRGLAELSTNSILRRAVRTMAAEYLKMMKTESLESEGGQMNDVEGCSVDAFVDDVWTFVPVAALTHCFSNLIHASKEGQLTTAIPVDDALHDREGTFNWLRHASDHISVFREYSQSFQNGI